MEMYGAYFIFGGFAMMALAQFAAAVIAFRISFAEGAMSLIIPGYLLFAMRKAGHYWSFFGAWFSGVLAMAIGTVMMS